MHPHINFLIRAGILVVLILAYIIISGMTDPAEKYLELAPAETNRTTNYPSNPLFDSSESESQTPTI